MTRLAVGCMTGTSIDSIDAALVEISGRGLEMTARFIRGASAPLGDLAARLRQLADQQPMTAGDIASLSRDFSLAHIPVIRQLLTDANADLISIHGQTVVHRPPVSWQFLTPAAIAHQLKRPIVYDLRAADLAAGGQGAPITPLADWVWFRRHRVAGGGGCIAVVNLGGFCNVTRLFAEPTDPRTIDQMVNAAKALGHPEMADGFRDKSPAKISGADVCPCNHLLDTIARRLFSAPYDEDGRRAEKGEPVSEAQEDLEGVLASLRRANRSLGTGDETGEWISRWRARCRAEDLAATACEAIAVLIAREVRADLVLLAGGGVKNRALRRAIESCCSCRVQLTDDLGLPASYREAACFAILGALCQDRIPITLPQVTHVPSPAPISGTWVLP
jgi:1,6-anhydro-N-acetylmuramate kinase